MRKRWIYATLIVLSLVMACGLAISCAVPSAKSPPSSEYPADISGHVTIAEKVIAKYDRNKPDTMELTPLEGEIYWIIDISVKNKAYENAVTASYKDWKIVADDKVYDPQKPFADIWPSTDMSVPVGGTGETTIRFPVPKTLNVSSAKLCYEGQEPYSYGKLSGGDKVAVYDWDLKKVVATSETLVETYVVYKGPITGSYTMLLRTIQRFTGDGNRVLEFSTDKSPLVINYGYTETSNIKSTFDVAVQSDKGSIYPVIGSNFWQVIMKNGTVLEGVGRYRIEVTASGCDWWIKVGVEQ